jgi:FkbM family methyltransferase
MGTSVSPRFAGVELRAADDDTAWLVAHQIASGEYRHDGLTPRAGWKVIDIGANIGVYSLWAARRGATVSAFEPEPETFACLVANTTGTHITPFQAAVVGAPRVVARLYLSDVRSTRHTLTGREIVSGRELTDVVEVPAITLDEVLAEGCDLLKLDCEGAEFEILAAVSEESLSRALRIILEFHRSIGTPETLTRRLERAGFETSVLAGTSSRDPVGLIGAVRESVAVQSS